MKKTLLLIGISLLSCFLFLTNISAQGTYGNTLLFDQVYSDYSGWSYTTNNVFTKNTFTFTYAGATVSGNLAPARGKTFTTMNNTVAITSKAYTGGIKCTSIEVSDFASLGQLNFAIQNGSGSSDSRFINSFLKLIRLVALP